MLTLKVAKPADGRLAQSALQNNSHYRCKWNSNE